MLPFGSPEAAAAMLRDWEWGVRQQFTAAVARHWRIKVLQPAKGRPVRVHEAGRACAHEIAESCAFVVVAALRLKREPVGLWRETILATVARLRKHEGVVRAIADVLLKQGSATGSARSSRTGR